MPACRVRRRSVPVATARAEILGVPAFESVTARERPSGLPDGDEVIPTNAAGVCTGRASDGEGRGRGGGPPTGGWGRGGGGGGAPGGGDWGPRGRGRRGFVGGEGPGPRQDAEEAGEGEVRAGPGGEQFSEPRRVRAREHRELRDGDVQLLRATSGDVDVDVHALGAGRRRARPRDAHGHEGEDGDHDHDAGSSPPITSSL